MKKALVVILMIAVMIASGCGMMDSGDEAVLTASPTADASGGKVKITEEQAIEIASQHWGIKTGDTDELTGYPFLIMPVDSTNDNYKIALKWLVNNEHYSMLDFVEIDSYTGEIISSDEEG